MLAMRTDCHVHLCAFTPGHGHMSRSLFSSLPFRFMNHCLKIGQPSLEAEQKLKSLLVRLLNETPELDAAVVLAFDAVYDESGQRDEANTHLFVENDYIAELSRQHKKVLFGASIHPYRRDAIAELTRCVNQGAVLVKWLPITQGIDPTHPKCLEFYEVMAALGIPLLSHTGWERTLPNINRLADPALLKPALDRGVIVIAAHCGTRSMPWEKSYLSSFVKMALHYEHFYGDTSALNWVPRSYAYKILINDPRLKKKLVHGSDWPIVPVPPFSQLRLDEIVELWRERNWIRRDVLIKQQMGFGEDHFTRLWNLLSTARRQALDERAR
jgi:predicted TIM-barrel fold metal-dependent hydrolase